MIFDGDFHLHTRASDGHCTVAELAKTARERGMRTIAVTDHSFSSLFCHQTAEKYQAQRQEIMREHGVNILQGIEANILDENGSLDVPDDVIRRSDVLICGFHRFVALMFKPCSRKFILVNGFMSEGARQKLRDYNTEIFLKALKRYPIDIIAHIGHRCPVDYVKICDACAKAGVYVELNEKHILDTHGIEEDIERILETGVNFTVGSDAHRADSLGRFDKVSAFIKKHGIPPERVFGADGNMPTFKDKSEWKDEF